MKIVPVACLYAGKIDMLERVKEAIMVHQTNKTAIMFGMAAAFLLESIILGADLKEALEKVAEKCIIAGWDDVSAACRRALSEAKSASLEELMQKMTDEKLGGRTCHFPSAFIVPMFLFHQAVADGEVNEEAYIKALRANILAAGDTCSRAVFIGAVLGACVEKVPKTWEDKFDQETLKKIDHATKEILESFG